MKYILLLFYSFLLFANSINAKEVNLYSAQKEHLIRPILNKFEEATGIKVNMVTVDKAALVARLENEGKHTPADLVLTVDIGNIYQLKERGLLQAVQSDIIKAQVPENLRDPENYWFGLTMRIRAILYNKTQVSEGMIKDYEDLADPRWKGALLIRSSTNVYNQSLVAAFLANNGEAKTVKWLEGIVSNLARNPEGGDTDQIKDLAAGVGKIAVANSYYFGRIALGDSKLINDAVKENVVMIFPNQSNRGAHVNIRGGGVTKYAKNKDNAVKLLEFLVGDEAQSFFANINFEFPVKPAIPLPDAIKSWGNDIKRDAINLEEVAKQQNRAIYLMDQAGWR